MLNPPLFSKLTSSDQKKVFAITNKRKVIVATNIAESSLTLPNIEFVIDSGLSKQKRINFNTGLESLMIDFVSKASANQRSSRRVFKERRLRNHVEGRYWVCEAV